MPPPGSVSLTIRPSESYVRVDLAPFQSSCTAPNKPASVYAYVSTRSVALARDTCRLTSRPSPEIVDETGAAYPKYVVTPPGLAIDCSASRPATYFRVVTPSGVVSVERRP